MYLGWTLCLISFDKTSRPARSASKATKYKLKNSCPQIVVYCTNSKETQTQGLCVSLLYVQYRYVFHYVAQDSTFTRGQSSKTKWFGIKSAKVFSVRMDVQFSSFVFNIRKWIAIQRNNMCILKCVCLCVNPCNTKFTERSNEPWLAR